MLSHHHHTNHFSYLTKVLLISLYVSLFLNTQKSLVNSKPHRVPTCLNSETYSLGFLEDEMKMKKYPSVSSLDEKYVVNSNDKKNPQNNLLSPSPSPSSGCPHHSTTPSPTIERIPDQKTKNKQGAGIELVFSPEYKNVDLFPKYRKSGRRTGKKRKVGLFPKVGNYLRAFIKWIGSFFKGSGGKGGSSSEEGKILLEEVRNADMEDVKILEDAEDIDSKKIAEFEARIAKKSEVKDDSIWFAPLSKFSNLGFELLNQPTFDVQGVFTQIAGEASSTQRFFVRLSQGILSQMIQSILLETCQLLETTRNEFKEKFGHYENWYDLVQDVENYPGVEDRVLVPLVKKLKTSLELVIKLNWGGLDREKVFQVVDSLKEELKKKRLEENKTSEL